jgi:hypothetical protein
MAIPTALAKPCPRGPVLTSTALDLLQGEVVAGQVQETVEEHGAVAGGEHEAVPVEPVGARRVVLQEAAPELVGHGRRPHGHAGVAAVGLLDGVHRQEAQRVDAELVQGFGIFFGEWIDGHGCVSFTLMR